MGILIILAGCQKEQLPEFTILKVSEDADVYVKFGDKLSIEIDDDDDQSYVVEDNTLVIHDDADAVLTIPEDKVSMITAIEADSNADLEFDSTAVWFFSNGLNIKVQDNGDVRLRLAAPFLNVNLTGESDLIISGDTCTTVNLTAADNSDFKAFDLIVRNYNITVSDNADAELNVTNSITGTVSDNAEVDYKGNPSTVDVTVDETASFTHVSK